jgi:hypothetical protein
LNIQKGELWVKGILTHGILTQDIGFVWGLFKGDSGDFQGRGGEGALSTICRGLAGFFEAQPGTPVPFALYCPCFVRKRSTLHRDGERWGWLSKWSSFPLRWPKDAQQPCAGDSLPERRVWNA